MCFNSEKRRNSVFCILSLLFFTIISCSDPNNIVIQEDNVNLKSIAQSYEKKVNWSSEIEKDRLKQKIPAVDGIDKSIKITPVNLVLSLEEEFVDPIYPEIKGLGKLNLSGLNIDQYELLDKFCSAVVADKNVEPYVSYNSFYTLVLFTYDIQQYSYKFSSYIAGEPFFEDEENVECPVRFYFKAKGEKEYFDVDIFLKLENEKWTISQIVYDIE